MNIIKKPVYQCEHCRKLYQIEKWAISHENKCTKNPVNERACFDCVYFESRKENYYFDSPLGGEDQMTVNVFHCNKLKVFIYPPKVEHANYDPYDFGYKDNIPMKRVCQHQKSLFEQFEHDALGFNL